jgi:hypothetical protein
MDPDLQDLLTAWLGGEMEAERRRALVERLRTDTGFRSSFVAELRMHGMLKAVQATEPRWLLLEDELHPQTQGESVPSPLAQQVMAAIQTPALPGISLWWRRLSWGLTALLVLVLGIWWGTGSRRRELATEISANSQPELAVIIKASRVVSASGPEMNLNEGTSLRAGVIELREGQLTLAFFNGATLHVAGPAKLELISLDRVFCTEGKLWAHVPPGAAGFTVLSPSAALTDRGTEFVFNIEPAGRAEAMVLQGQAEFSALSTNGAVLRSQLLLQHHSAEIDGGSGHIHSTRFTTSRFLAAPQITLPTLDLPAAYAQAVLASEPESYWRLEHLQNGIITNTIPGRAGLIVQGPLQTIAETSGNHTLMFGPGHAEQVLISEDMWTPNGKTGYAIELWFASEAFNNCTLFAATKAGGRHFALLELSARNPELVHKPGTIRYLHRWPPGNEGGVNLFSRNTYLPYRWHHLVAQRNGSIMELYVDGQLTSQTKLDDPEKNLPCQIILGRRQADPKVADPRGFVGRLDEVAVYNHPLTPNEINHHASFLNRNGIRTTLTKK